MSNSGVPARHIPLTGIVPLDVFAPRFYRTFPLSGVMTTAFVVLKLVCPANGIATGKVEHAKNMFAQYGNCVVSSWYIVASKLYFPPR